MKTLAGIVIYNANVARLKENISAISLQVDEIVIIDNGSENVAEIEKIYKQRDDITFIKNIENLGIAKALNQICEYADQNYYPWVLSLDQDSVVEPKLIENYEKYLKTVPDDVGMLTCYVKDRNFSYENSDKLETKDVCFCITSGCLLRIEAWKEIGKYDEDLFIDRVDTDFCHRLIVAKKRIMKIGYIGLLHEIGNKTSVKNIFGKKVTVFNHSPFRMYYIVRNSIYYAYKHRYTENFWGNYCAAYNRMLVVILFETNKRKKLLRGLEGIIDGHKMIYRMRNNE